MTERTQTADLDPTMPERRRHSTTFVGQETTTLFFIYECLRQHASKHNEPCGYHFNRARVSSRALLL